MDNNLSTFLANQYAAQKEQDLAQLKSSYEKGERAIDEQIAALPAQYSSARNDTAAQNAIAKKNFNEQAAATGLNSGTSGQAELARSNAYMSAIANLNRSEAEAKQKLERDRVNWKNDYENAIAARSAASDAALNSALYQELVRQDNANRENARWEAQFNEDVRRYNQDFAAMGGSSSGGSSSGGSSVGSSSGGGNTQTGYDTHGYTTEEIKALQRNAGITVDGVWGPDTQAAYENRWRPEGRIAFGTTAEVDVAEMIRNGASEAAIFAYIDELTHANYLTPSENTSLKLKYRQGKIGTN